MSREDALFYLEFAKVLAPILAVSIGAFWAVRGFRKQKQIERRLSWYEDMVKQLTRTGDAVALAAVHGGVATARDEVSILLSLTYQGLMYVERGGVAAIEELIDSLKVLQGRDSIPSGSAVKVVAACHVTMTRLVIEMRRDLRLVPRWPRLPKQFWGEFVRLSMEQSHSSHSRGYNP